MVTATEQREKGMIFKMNIVFMGTPDFAKESLKALVEAGHKISLVITNPDRPKGRGMKFQYSPVKEYAEEQGLEIAQPLKIRNNEDIVNRIKEKNPDVICIVAYGKIIPNEIIEIPKKGTINVHGSLLPKYRGAAPIQWAVLNGDKKTGITTMYVNEKMDEGDMLLKEETEIGEDETVGELWQRLAKMGGRLLVETLVQIEAGTIKRIPQTTEGLEEPTYAPMLAKTIANIDWENKTAQEIKNLVRGLNPIMGAHTTIKDKKIKLWTVKVLKTEEFMEQYNCKIEEYNKTKNGEILLADQKKGLFLKANEGVISVIELQAENAKKMNVLDFLRGNNFNV